VPFASAQNLIVRGDITGIQVMEKLRVLRENGRR
jgi:hypothetical protein